MKKVLVGIILSVSFVCSAVAPSFAAPAARFKICISTASKALTVRPKCIKGETAIRSLQGLSTRLDALPGSNSNFQVVLSDGSDIANTVPAGTSDGLGGVISGTLSKSAECASGILFASSCESSVTDIHISVARGLSAEGTKVTCNWSNTSLTPINGTFVAKAVCLEV